ncbi:MAG: transglutaminaseTgpA domain-containing protein [Egibacteraceae bacterium]
MTALADPPRTDGPSAPRSPQSPPAAAAALPQAGLGRLVLLLLLVAATAAPLGEVFEGTAWLAPLAAAGLGASALAWAASRLPLGGPLRWLVALIGWVVFSSALLAPTTTLAGVVPTRETLEVARDLLAALPEAIAESVAPVAPGAPLLLLATSAVWLLATALAETLLVRAAALPTLALAVVAFAVPLPLVDTRGLWLVVPLLAVSGLVLAATGALDLSRWSGGRAPRPRPGALAAAAAMLAAATVAALTLAEALPGFDEPPLYEVRGGGGSTVTTNPMVDLRPALTAEDTGPILEVRSPRPVYLRTTALDVYDDEQWTTERIQGTTVADGIEPEVTPGAAEELTVAVDVLDLDAVLVPAPYPPIGVDGPRAEVFQHDPRSGTLTLERGERLGAGDAYEVTAALPDPDPERLDGAEGFAPDSALTDLPPSVPDELGALAEEITTAAGADTPLRQALAIQRELQSWTYSLDPPIGHSGGALVDFLEARVGYCEQFAATMALMLRTLDVPSRVAVGYTPGELVDADEGVWQVSDANAHAWVEVLLPGAGWVPFEPTPRSDGNVLVPSGGDLLAADTAAGDLAGAPDEPAEGDDADEAAGPDGVVPELEGEGADASAAEADPAAGGEDAGLGWAPALALLAGVAAAGALVLRARRAGGPADPRERIRRSRQAALRLGAGLGVRPRASETDRETLTRIAALAAAGADAPAHRLAAASGRARFAPEVDEEEAVAAERALAGLTAAVPAPYTRSEQLRRRAREMWQSVVSRGSSRAR